MDQRAAMKKQGLWWAIVIGCLVGMFGQLGKAYADTIPDPVSVGCNISNLDECPVIPFPDPPGVEAVIELEKLVFELGETIEGTFTITNNNDEVLYDVATHFWDRIVLMRNSNGYEVFTTFQGTTVGFPEPRQVSINPGESWIVPFSWDQREYISSWEQVEPGEYTVWGFTPFDGGYDSVVITIIPEPMTGLLVLVMACSVMGRRQPR